MIDGSEIAKHILLKLRSEVKRLYFTPLFCDVLVGADPVSASFVKIKGKKAEEIGLKFELVELPVDVTTEDLVARLKKIQQDPFLSGLIVQLPLPEGIDKSVVLNAIDPRVDVDCLGGENTRKFYEGRAKMVPPTAAAVIAVLDSFKLNMDSLQILVVGQGNLVGKPVAHLLQEKGYNIITADEKTENLKDLTLSADIIISATGSAKLINGDMVKTDAVLIDCGTSESAGSIVGDIDTESVWAKTRFISPVPGGVGPVTVAKLLQNVVAVAKDLE